jgi:hypothetical protein
VSEEMNKTEIDLEEYLAIRYIYAKECNTNDLDECAKELFEYKAKKCAQQLIDKKETNKKLR